MNPYGSPSGAYPPPPSPPGPPDFTPTARVSPPGNNGTPAFANLASPAARIELRTPDGATQVVPLGVGPLTVGRADTNALVVKDDWVSRSHMEITRGPDGRYYAQDKESRNGVLVNGQPVKFAPLSPGDTIQLGQNLLIFSILPSPNGIPGGDLSGGDGTVIGGQTIIGQSGGATGDDQAGVAVHFLLAGRAEATIGRAPNSDLVLDHIQISRRHSHIRWNGQQYLITDLGSTNGTYVDGNRIAGDVPLTEGARVQIGPFRYRFNHNTLWRQHDQIRVDTVLVNQQVGGGKLLLRDVSFSILPKEFVCIVGGSGAGKSTLMDAVSGVRPASHGQVLYNGTDYYENLDEFRSLIGYVPQDDIVPSYLTVRQALTYAARLRLPPDARPEEIKSRVNRAMAAMELTERADLDIHRLSGGQRKRVSIAVEYLTDPTLFFLDEPTSGLDPGLETRMMQLMRKVADEGKTVILVTHATQNVTLCDKVIFMAPGGYLAFFGPPKEALEFFGVETFAEIYVLLDPLTHPGAPAEWAKRYAESTYQDRYVDDRVNAIIQARQVQQQRGLPPPAIQPDQKLQRAQAISQFRTLTERYIATIVKDRQNLLITLLQAPIIGLLLGLSFRSLNPFLVEIMNRADPMGRAFQDVKWNPSSGASLTCLLVVVALWFGVSNSAREIVKEASIYRRERLVNLQLGPYLTSKFVVLFVICMMQNLIMLGIVGLMIPYNLRLFGPKPGLTGQLIETQNFEGSWGKSFATMLVVSFVGVAMGLFISTLVSNPDRAASIVPIILIPQVLFSGTIVRYNDLGSQKFLAWPWAGHWGVQAVGQATGVAPVMDEWARRFGATSVFWVGLWPSVAAMLVIAAICILGTVWSLQRKDIKRQLARLRKATPAQSVNQTGQFRTA